MAGKTRVVNVYKGDDGLYHFGKREAKPRAIQPLSESTRARDGEQ